MSKISELSDGGALQSTDYLIAVRSGGNVKVQPAGMTFSSVTITSSDINGGTIDGVTIGGSSAGAGSFTTLTASGDVNVDSGTLFVDVSANNVGINTTSPNTALDVIGTTTSGIRLKSQESASNGFNIYNDSSSDLAYLMNYYNGSMIFGVNNTEQMRLTSSGLQVGTTDIDLGYTDGDSGVVLNPDGFIQAARDSGFSILYLNKLNNDGKIIQMSKDGIEVGNIGYNTGAFTVDGAASRSGLYFGNGALLPRYNGALVDGANADLGASTQRFENLYLSGGVYLGGTGAANLLDDYEEGTHNTTVSFTSGSVTLSSNTLVYTKIGRQVIVTGYVAISGTSSPSGLMRFTLPFPVAAGTQYRAAANVKFNQLLSGNNITTAAWAIAEQNTSTVAVYGGSGSSVDLGTGGRIATNTDFRVSVLYITSA